MKVIVTYASAGAGHRKAAEALYGYLKAHRPDCQPALVDFLDHTGPFFRTSYRSWYANLVTRLPTIWRLLFWLTSSRLTRRVTRFFAYTGNLIATGGFAGYLVRENPAYVLSTHFVASEIAARLIRQKKITSKLVTVVTDFGVHPFWVCPGTHLYTVASEQTKGVLAGLGVPAGQIKVTGIPIDEKFLNVPARAGLYEKYGLSPHLFTVLLSTGSFGMGPMEKVVQELSGEMQCLVLCASNKKLQDRLIEARYPHCKVYGFVDTMHELMTVADVLLAKPGGLTVSESLVCGIFPIFMTAIPGQETENVKFLAAHEVGCMATTVEAICARIRQLSVNAPQIGEARERMRLIAKPSAARDVCDALR